MENIHTMSTKNLENVHSEASDIVKIFGNKTIVLTGATGYLGRLLIEKLLRTCSGLRKIYVIVRMKKGKDPTSRYEEIFSGPLWKKLEDTQPNYREKISLMHGDLSHQNLGIKNADIQILQEEVDFVIHCAATVRFDQHIKMATYINIRAVQDFLRICKGMKNLKVFLHVSTAYSFSPRAKIDEKFYKPPIAPDDLLNLVECLSEKKLSEITPALLDDWPNTYVFTKSIGEDLIRQEGKDLPLVMVRPAIVTATVAEPIVGWIDNIYGPSGVFLAVALGLLRSMLINPNAALDMVPADYTINLIIAALARKCKDWNNAVSLEGVDRGRNTVPIYNFCSSPESKITYGSFYRDGRRIGVNYASTQCLWELADPVQENYILHRLTVLFCQTLPSYLIDFVLLLRGKEPMAVAASRRIDKFGDVLAHFATREWNFSIANTQELWTSLSIEDKTLFPFTMKNFDWMAYLENYIIGIRLYIMKDPLDTIPAGKKKRKILLVLYYTVVSVFILIFLMFLKLCLNGIFLLF